MTFGFAGAGACTRQQSMDGGIAVLPHWLAICLQQARSAGFRCAMGSAQAIVGAISGRIIVNSKANWHTAFTTASILYRTAQLLKNGHHINRHAPTQLSSSGMTRRRRLETYPSSHFGTPSFPCQSNGLLRAYSWRAVCASAAFTSVLPHPASARTRGACIA